MYGPQDSLLNSIRQSVYNSLNINERYVDNSRRRAGGRTGERTDGQITFVIFQLILKLFKSILTICTAILDINIIIGTYSF